MATKIDISRPGIAFDLDTSPYRDSPEKTVMILGLPRGGTTMVAGIARLAGLHIGDDLPVNLEDRAFVRRKMPELHLAVAARNAERPVWGWKYPRAADYLLRLMPEIRNPFVIVVWRDLFSVATRSLRKGNDLTAALHHAMRMVQKNMTLLAKFDGPKLMVSYEKALQRPIDLAKDICAFLSLPVTFDRDAVKRFAEPGRYKATDA